jgi:hypothetical protein
MSAPNMNMEQVLEEIFVDEVYLFPRAMLFDIVTSNRKE